MRAKELFSALVISGQVSVIAGPRKYLNREAYRAEYKEHGHFIHDIFNLLVLSKLGTAYGKFKRHEDTVRLTAVGVCVDPIKMLDDFNHGCLINMYHSCGETVKGDVHLILPNHGEEFIKKFYKKLLEIGYATSITIIKDRIHIYLKRSDAKRLFLEKFIKHSPRFLRKQYSRRNHIGLVYYPSFDIEVRDKILSLLPSDYRTISVNHKEVMACSLAELPYTYIRAAAKSKLALKFKNRNVIFNGLLKSLFDGNTAVLGITKSWDARIVKEFGGRLIGIGDPTSYHPSLREIVDYWVDLRQSKTAQRQLENYMKEITHGRR